MQRCVSFNCIFNLYGEYILYVLRAAFAIFYFILVLSLLVNYYLSRHVHAICHMSILNLVPSLHTAFCCASYLLQICSLSSPSNILLHGIFGVQLVLLQFGSDPLVEETDVCTGREMLTTNPGSLGTLVFVVRRPG